MATSFGLGPAKGSSPACTTATRYPHSDGCQAGLHVWLTQRGFEQLLGAAAGAMANRGVRLEDLFGASGAALGGRLLDAADEASRFAAMDDALRVWLDRWMARDQPIRPEIAWAFRQLRRNPAQGVADLARQIGCSRKTLTAHFRARYGIAPKTAARLARFETVLAACEAGAPEWASVAHDAGYFDQSHMIRDFTDFAGLTPAQYAARLVAGIGVVEPGR